MNQARAIKIAVTAMGGQGGGVLANWIVQVGEQNGFVAQTTSVPGVAQRTGATVYYVELFPLDAVKETGKQPVLALMPTPGDVDIVIAAEMMEAGRAVKRGFVTSQTTLIASTHRDYAISEKIGLGDTRQDSERVLAACQDIAGVFVGADMAAEATEAGAVISAVLFGALAGSGALPIERSRYEETIHQMGRAVEANLRGFGAGFSIANNGLETAALKDKTSAHSSVSPIGASALRDRMKANLPASTHYYTNEGVKRTIDFQDERYAATYLEHLEVLNAQDKEHGGERRDYLLTETLAKHLALWMTYEDTIRVADLKTRESRFDRFRDDVRAAEGQIVEIREFMHPRVEEICDMMPTPMAQFVLSNSVLRRALKTILGEGRRVSTTKLRGFLPLYLIASLRYLRRSSFRYKVEHKRIAAWLSAVTDALKDDYDLAISIAKTQRLIKGYGDTHERGLGNFNKIMSALPAIKATQNPARSLDACVEAALKDEDGDKLSEAFAAINALIDNIGSGEARL